MYKNEINEEREILKTTEAFSGRSFISISAEIQSLEVLRFLAIFSAVFRFLIGLYVPLIKRKKAALCSWEKRRKF